MRHFFSLFIPSIICFSNTVSTAAFADDAQSQTNSEISTSSEPSKPVEIASAAPEKPFNAFTGKVMKNKVRVRLQPTLDAVVIKELGKDDLIVVVGESDDFYAVQPPPETKAYIFRTFVLDNVVEGNRVNVRLEPNTDAPVIAQVNQGERIQGTVSPINSKWLEIAPPTTARFYVAKEYIEKVGDPSMMAVVAKRKDEVNKLLSSVYAKSQEEMQKTFENIQYDALVGMYQKVINQYSEFTDQAARAKELLGKLQDAYLKKKIAFLENKTELLTQQQKEAAVKAAAAIAAASGPKPVQQPAPVKASNKLVAINDTQEDSTPMVKQNNWLPLENNIYAEWAKDNGQASQDDFYQQQRDSAVILKGIVEVNPTTVKNKPGDYVLVNPNSQLPIAYLYSTKVDLQSKVGKPVTLQAAPRPNHHFAFPAYFVLDVN